jgi:hypothetical protein
VESGEWSVEREREERDMTNALTFVLWLSFEGLWIALASFPDLDLCTAWRERSGQPALCLPVGERPRTGELDFRPIRQEERV